MKALRDRKHEKRVGIERKYRRSIKRRILDYLRHNDLRSHGTLSLN